MAGVLFSWTKPNHLPHKLLTSACGESMLRSGPTLGRWNLTWSMKEEKQPSGQVFHRRGDSMAKGPEVGSHCCIGERRNRVNVAESQWAAWHGAETSRDQTKQSLASRMEELGLCPKYSSMLQMETLKISEVIAQKQMALECLSKNLRTGRCEYRAHVFNHAPTKPEVKVATTCTCSWRSSSRLLTQSRLSPTTKMTDNELCVSRGLEAQRTCIPRQFLAHPLATSRYMGSVNFQRHINVHLHNALIVQKPLDKSVKVTKRPMQMVKQESEMPKLKGVKGPGQSFTGKRFMEICCLNKNGLPHKLSQYDASKSRGIFFKVRICKRLN